MKREIWDELMHGAIDGTNTPAEAEELRILLSENPEAAARWRELEALAELLDSVPAASPPARVRDNILRTVGGLTPRGKKFGPTRQPWRFGLVLGDRAEDQKGVSTMKSNGKWIFAAAAAIVIVAAVGYIGLRQSPSDDAATGAIGAVKKHRAPQISEQDVVLGTDTAPAWAPYGDFFGDAATLGKVSGALGSMANRLEAMSTLDQRQALAADMQGVLDTLAARSDSLGQRAADALRLQAGDYSTILNAKALDVAPGTIDTLRQRVSELGSGLGSSGPIDLAALPRYVEHASAISNQLGAASLLEARSLASASERFASLAAKLENASDLDRNASGPLKSDIDAVRTQLGARQDTLAARNSLDRLEFLRAMSLQAKTLESAMKDLDGVVNRLGAKTQLDQRTELDALRPQLNGLAAKMLEQRSELEAKASLGLRTQLESMRLQQKSLESMRQSLDPASRSLEARASTFGKDGFETLKASLGAMSEGLGSATLDTNRQFGRLAGAQLGAVSRALEAKSAGDLGAKALDALGSHFNALAASVREANALGSAADLQKFDSQLGHLKTLGVKSLEAKTGTD